MNHVQLSANKIVHLVMILFLDLYKLIYDKLAIQYYTLYHLQFLKNIKLLQSLNIIHC